MSNSDISNESDIQVCIFIKTGNVVGQSQPGDPGWVVGSQFPGWQPGQSGLVETNGATTGPRLTLPFRPDKVKCWSVRSEMSGGWRWVV